MNNNKFFKILFAFSSIKMYQVKTDIISEKEFETAIQVVRESDLKVRKTPFIKVSKDRHENKR